MAFSVYFGTSNKRINSTFQADWSGTWTKTEATWKNAKDLDTPVLEIYIPDLSSYPNWNQFYIEEVSSYYWVTSIISVRKDVWQVAGVMDALATYRKEILDTECYIEFGYNTDASGVSTRLADRRQSISVVPLVTTTESDITGDILVPAYGCYVMTAIGSNGSVTAWLLTLADMRRLTSSLSQQIADETEGMTTEEADTYFKTKLLSQGTAMSAIRSCIWLPFRYDSVPHEETRSDIYLGDFKTGTTGFKIGSNSLITKETDLTIPWQASDWKRMNHQVQMYLPFIGTIEIPLTQCNNVDSVHVTWVAEVLTGGITIRVTAGDYTVFTGSANIGNNYAIGQNVLPYQQTQTASMTRGSSEISTIGGAVSIASGVAMALAGASVIASQGATLPAVSGILAGTGMAVGGISSINTAQKQDVSAQWQNLSPITQCVGSLTNSASLGQNLKAKIVCLYFAPIDDTAFSKIYGHPVLRIGKPATGYCKTVGFSIAGNMRLNEKGAISQMMDAGVFIE